MLQLKNIKKTYGLKTKEKIDDVKALKGITLDFRDNEFVSILGPSGCGKTTFLNIIGGLDNYTSGDLIINGKSTKEFTDRDWDTYRNHSVGFVFQNYNLISHQTILENVELALTLAGIDNKTRRKKAKEALATVGLSDKINNKPSELSGGQMQRVAIARALVSDPEILLADEPTGALDSETSVQIMDLLKQVSKERLVIMVTHNPDLARKYSTRIIKLLDGNVIDDSNPYKATKTDLENSKKKQINNKKTFMKLKTALSLSFRNLMTKKGRTVLTAFAGSIGIIGIALIMSLSNGIQTYIDSIEEETLSSYPIKIEKESIDLNTMMEVMMGEKKLNTNEKKNKIYSTNIINDMLTTLSQKSNSNNLKEFKKYLEEDNTIKNLSNDIQYSYNLDINLYNTDNDKVVRVNPSTVLDTIGMGDIYSSYNSSDASSIMSGSPMVQMMTNTDVFSELYNKKLLKNQYNLVAGSWPSKYNEVLLMIDKDGHISDYTLYSLGLKDQEELKNKWEKIKNGEKLSLEKIDSYEYDKFLNLKFKLILNNEYYKKEKGIWKDKSEDSAYMKNILNSAEDIKIVGIIKQKDDAISSSITGGIGYTKELKEYVIDKSNNSEIVKEQMNNKNINVFSGLNFPKKSDEKFDIKSLSPEQKAALATMSSEEIAEMMDVYKENSSATYEKNLEKLGAINLSDPTAVSIYPKNFDSKEEISSTIKKYNKKQEKNNKDENSITYSDIVGTMIASVSKIVNIISYVLIAFVSISLVVSSIMIAIITYISVLERTKEIGILRSIGASKKDVSRVFNAETVIEGFIAGVFGIVVTLLISIPVNIICKAKLGISTICLLPIAGGVGLIILSVLLTLIAGIIPSRMASKQNPADALRSE